MKLAQHNIQCCSMVLMMIKRHVKFLKLTLLAKDTVVADANLNTVYVKFEV